MKKIFLTSLILLLSIFCVACGVEEDEGKLSDTDSMENETVEREEVSKADVSKPQFISNRSVNYDEANEKYSVFWAFSNSQNGPYMKADATIIIKITNDNGEVVFNKSYDVDETDYSEFTNNSWGENRLLGCIDVSVSEIIAGTRDTGKVSISASLEDGTYWEEELIAISGLPEKEISFVFPTLPYAVHKYGYPNDTLEQTIDVLEIKTESSDYGGLRLIIKAKMVYNSKGNNSSDYLEVGYKIKDSEGIILDSSSFVAGPLSVGEIIVAEEWLNGKYELGETYILELTDIKGL